MKDFACSIRLGLIDKAKDYTLSNNLIAAGAGAAIVLALAVSL